MQKIKFDFSQKMVLVTGGAQGIGLEIAKKFLESGAQVAIWDYSEKALATAQAELASFQQRVSFFEVNVASIASCEAAAERLAAPLDILVNNAGITRDKSFVKMEVTEFDQVIDTNLNGIFYVTKSLFSKFNEMSKNRRIINLSSVVALYGNFGQTNYVAAKSGVIGLTKTWAKEFGRKGFTVNAIAPGYTKTAMVAAVPAEILKSMESKVPTQRLGEVADIANACLFLSSAEASYINGVVLSVDGGLVIS